MKRQGKPLFLETERRSNIASGRLHFMSAPFEEESEITGHPSLTITTSLSSRDGSDPTDIDIFITIHHYDNNGKEGELSQSR
jgi:hypothetical protein